MRYGMRPETTALSVRLTSIAAAAYKRGGLDYVAVTDEGSGVFPSTSR
jgi:hypothetical protein